MRQPFIRHSVDIEHHEFTVLRVHKVHRIAEVRIVSGAVAVGVRVS